MARRYRKRRVRARSPQVVDKSQAVKGRESVELPASVVEIIEGVSQEAEQLAGQARPAPDCNAVDAPAGLRGAGREEGTGNQAARGP